MSQTCTFKLKENYNSIIPLKIYQTWYTKNLPNHMKDAVELLKNTNPEFEHYLFDDNDCRNFIKNNFNEISIINDELQQELETMRPGERPSEEAQEKI